MNDQDLADSFSEALDLLDELVDPLLDTGVCKGRVTTWKTMMRANIDRERGVRARTETESEEAQRLSRVQKYVADLCFKAPEIFPSGMEVQFEVGHILGMWGAKS